MSYVTLKVKTALRLGFKEVQENRPADIPEAELLELIDRYNRDVSIHGILVQLPLPPHISEERVINAIDPEKDVVGFHPVNLGRVVLGGGRGFLPCTPAGIRKMIVRSGPDTRGAEIVVVGRSNIVGKPIALMMGQWGVDGTVTLVHTRTRDLAGHCRRADILIVAAGCPAWCGRNGASRERRSSTSESTALVLMKKRARRFWPGMWISRKPARLLERLRSFPAG